MELRHLRTFNAVAQHLSISAAARELHFAQSTVSEQIATLEKGLGVALFVRRRSGLSLTHHGRRLFSQSPRLISWTDRLEKSVSDRQVDTSIRIGMLEALTHGLSRALVEFRRRRPLVHVQIISGNRGSLFRGVEGGRLDACVTFGAPPDRFDLATDVIAHDELVVIAPMAHRLAGTERADVSALHGEQFIVTDPGCGFREMFDQHLGGIPDIPDPEMTVQNIGMIVECVRQGLGCALLPVVAVSRHVDSAHVWPVRMSGKTLQSSINVSCLANDDHRDAASASEESVLAFRDLLADSLVFEASAVAAAERSSGGRHLRAPLVSG